jgi:hypothetical protein
MSLGVGVPFNFNKLGGGGAAPVNILTSYQLGIQPKLGLQVIQ